MSHEYAILTGIIIKTTQKAVLFELEGEAIWVPKSVIHGEDYLTTCGEETDIGVKTWFLDKEGFEY